MKNQLGEKVMTDLAALRPKTDSCLRDGNGENKKAKVINTSKIIIKLD